MGGIFKIGETKVRPGAYFRTTKKEESEENVLDGVVAITFRANSGPLNTIIEFSDEKEVETMFGKGFTTDAIKQAFKGGAKTVLACRVGKGGTTSNVKLKKQSEDVDALCITAKYPGTREFSVTIREKLDSEEKECIIYDDTTVLETINFEKGGNEAESLASAFTDTSMFTAQIENSGGELEAVSQKAFTNGTDVTTTVAEYQKGFEMLETAEFNVLCVDTEEVAVHKLLSEFLTRIYNAGQFAQGVVAEKSNVSLETRVGHAESFDDEKMVYVLNANLVDDGNIIDGYQTAARIAGMLAGYAANNSLTHKVLKKVTEIKENLTPTQMEAVETRGCLVFSYNSNKEVWIDNAINTLINLKENQDKGWKKIRRVKTRFELQRRLLSQAESLVGNLDNDQNGRSTLISQLDTIVEAMINESKITSCKITESSDFPADGDSVWLDIDVIDKDSAEHMYLTFQYQFSTNEE